MPEPTIMRRTTGVLGTIYDRARYLLRYRRNPAVYVAIGLVAVLTGWRLSSGTPISEILSENYIESMLILAAGVITRLQVWSPQSVEDLVATTEAVHIAGDLVEFDPRLAEDPEEGPANPEGQD